MGLEGGCQKHCPAELWVEQSTVTFPTSFSRSTAIAPGFLSEIAFPTGTSLHSLAGNIAAQLAFLAGLKSVGKHREFTGNTQADWIMSWVRGTNGNRLSTSASWPMLLGFPKPLLGEMLWSFAELRGQARLHFQVQVKFDTEIRKVSFVWRPYTRHELNSWP